MRAVNDFYSLLGVLAGFSRHSCSFSRLVKFQAARNASATLTGIDYLIFSAFLFLGNHLWAVITVSSGQSMHSGGLSLVLQSTGAETASTGGHEQ